MQRKMSITQTYYLAHTARGKLATAAAQSDHNLRLLVGHANLLDALTIELQDAENSQQVTFNQTTKGSPKQGAQPQIAWSSSIMEESEDMANYEAEPDSDDDENDFFKSAEHIVKLVGGSLSGFDDPTANFMLPPSIDEEEETDEDEEDITDLSLIRVPSHSDQVPELIMDASDESDDDSVASPPPSPANMHAQDTITMDFGFNYANKQQTIEPTAHFQGDDGFYTSQQGLSPMIAVC